MALKRKNRDAGNSDLPKRSREGLLLSEKAKVLNFNKEKKSHAEVTKIDGKNESSIREIVTKKEEMCASSAVTPQNANTSSQKHCIISHHTKRGRVSTGQ